METKIFVFDQNTEDMEKVKEFLESHNYMVVATDSIAATEEIVGNQEFDLYIIDIAQHGLQIFRNIRCKSKYRSMMVYTNNIAMKPMFELINLGIDGYIFKSDSNGEFLQQIHKILGDN